MQADIKEQLTVLFDQLTVAIEEDTQVVSTAQTRLEKNKALRDHIKSSLLAYKVADGKGDGERILEVISGLPSKPFQARDVMKEHNRLFPETPITMRQVGVHLYRMLSRGRGTFRQTTKGVGGKTALYEKVEAPQVRTRTRTGENQSNELIPSNGATAGHFQ